MGVGIYLNGERDVLVGARNKPSHRTTSVYDKTQGNTKAGQAPTTR